MQRGFVLRKIEHIEQQIQELTAGEFKELREWIIERDWKAWDAQIEADAKNGKLDKLIDKIVSQQLHRAPRDA